VPDHARLITLDEAAVPFYTTLSLLAWARRTNVPRPYPFVAGVELHGTIYFDEREVDELAQHLWEVVHDIRTKHDAPDWWFHLLAGAEETPVYRAMLDHLAKTARRQEADM